jgi:hypothetical protein
MSTAMITELRWRSPRRWTDDSARVTCWPSRCGRYRVLRWRSLFIRVGPRKKHEVRYYAVARECGLGEPFWAILREPGRRRHWYQSRAHAEAACQRDADDE